MYPVAEGKLSYYAYGGDFSDFLNDADFILDGLVGSDHSELPGLTEYKKAIEPVTVTMVGSQFEVRNRYDFIDLTHLDVTWHLVDGSSTGHPVDLELPMIPAGQAKLIEPPIALNGERGDTWLTMNFFLKADMPWASKGHEVAWAQIPLFRDQRFVLEPSLPSSVESLDIRQIGRRLHMTTPSFKSMFIFDLVSGNLQWSNEAGAIMDKGPELSFYRALTQNDHGSRGNGAEWKKLHVALAKPQVKSASWKIENGIVVIEATIRVASPVWEWACNTKITYRITPTSMTLHTKGHFSGNHPESLPRIGLSMRVPKHYDKAI